MFPGMEHKTPLSASPQVVLVMVPDFWVGGQDPSTSSGMLAPCTDISFLFTTRMICDPGWCPSHCQASPSGHFIICPRLAHSCTQMSRNRANWKIMDGLITCTTYLHNDSHKVIQVKQKATGDHANWLPTWACRTLHNPSSSWLAPHFGLLPVSIASKGF